MATCSIIRNAGSEAHDLPGHPECEARLAVALGGVPADIRSLAAMPATEEEIALVHDPFYVGIVQDRCKATRHAGFLDPDTYVTAASFGIAASAAGCAIAAAERSADGEHCFAFVRPPGHHAERNHSKGFCIFNNAAIAAAALRSRGRVAIVDWDYHHGNGTQHAFYDSDKVLFCSVHDGNAFPFSGSVMETGAGSGTGYTINAPLAAGAAISDYLLVFENVFAPALKKFDPDVLIISAGQDILSDDPLGTMCIHAEESGALVHSLKSACEIPFALVLEGGYGPSHGAAVASIFRALRSDRAEATAGTGNPLNPRTVQTVEALRQLHGL